MPSPLPVSYEEWENRARQILPKPAFDYIDGGAGREATAKGNVEAFNPIRLQPRMLRGVAERDLSITLLGQKFPLPFFLAPLSIQGIANREGELASGRAASFFGTPFILSTASSWPMEDVAEAMGTAPRWFQLFWVKDEDVVKSFLQRAERAGYTAIVLTVDFPVYGWRERDVRNGYVPFLSGEGLANFFTDPAFRAKLKNPPEKDLNEGVRYFTRIFFNPGLTWKDLPRLKRYTKLPILVKGILLPQDAIAALENGADGIVVSNHGGRQVDGAVATINVLPEILEALKGRIPVLMDSGIRGGADIIKALALGASAVFIGRPYVYGLAVAGEEGVRRVIDNMRTDLDLTMANVGCKSIREIDRSLLHKER